MQPIKFRLAQKQDINLVKQWLAKPHVLPWYRHAIDVTHQDMKNFIKQRDSFFKHWIAMLENKPFGYILVADARDKQAAYFQEYLPINGTAIEVAFLIGETGFLEQGFGYQTLKNFFADLPQGINTILLLVDSLNQRAFFLYEKLGFMVVGEYHSPSGHLLGKKFYIMKKFRKISSAANSLPLYCNYD